METILTSQRVHVEALVARRFRPFALAVVFALSAACERSASVSDVAAE